MSQYTQWKITYCKSYDMQKALDSIERSSEISHIRLLEEGKKEGVKV